MLGLMDKFPQPLDDAALAVAVAIEAAAGVKRTWTVLEPCVVNRFGVLVTVAINYDTPTALCAIKLKKYVTYGSAVGAVELASITIPDGKAAGSVIWASDLDNELNKCALKPGEQLVAEVTTQGAGGAAKAGDYIPFFSCAPRGESLGNMANVSESA